MVPTPAAKYITLESWYIQTCDYMRGVIPLHNMISGDFFVKVISNHLHPPIIRQVSRGNNWRTTTEKENFQMSVPLWAIRILYSLQGRPSIWRVDFLFPSKGRESRTILRRNNRPISYFSMVFS